MALSIVNSTILIPELSQLVAQSIEDVFVNSMLSVLKVVDEEFAYAVADIVGVVDDVV